LLQITGVIPDAGSQAVIRGVDVSLG